MIKILLIVALPLVVVWGIYKLVGLSIDRERARAAELRKMYPYNAKLAYQDRGDVFPRGRRDIH